MGMSWAWWGQPRGYNTWKSQFDEVLNDWTEQASKSTGRTESNMYSTKSSSSAEAGSSKDQPRTNTSSAEDYIIDPITNRKVPRSTYGPVEDSAAHNSESFKAYRAQFATFAPPNDEAKRNHIYSDGPPPSAELKEYGQVDIDQELSRDIKGEGTSSLGDNADFYRDPIIQSEEYALNHLPPEEPDEQYDDLHRFHEQAADPTKKYEDLDDYKTYGDREAQEVDVPQEHQDLHEYRPSSFDESPDIASQATQYDDLNQYETYKDQEVPEKDSSSPKYEDLDKYKHYNDEGKLVEDQIPKYEDLDKYSTTNFEDPIVEERPFQQYGDLEQYRAFKYQELDGKSALERDIVAESLGEFDAKEPEMVIDKNPTSTIVERLERLNLDDTHTSHSNSTSSFSPLRQKAETREDLERSMASHNEASDAIDREASSNIRRSRAGSVNEENSVSQHQLTGNYVRDFPEEFSGSWTSQARSLGLDPVLETESNIQAAEKQYADQLSKSTNSARLETSLDRQQSEPNETRSSKGMLNHHSREDPEVDPYSREPQGLEMSYMKERDGEETPQTFVKSYADKNYVGEPTDVVWENSSAEKGTSQIIPPFESLYHRDPEIDGLPASPPESDPKAEPGSLNQVSEPIVYKILAYDPTMQKIDIAETTSIVPDQASPLTPAEVLLRLSNPTKFFPHFSALQAEGFEIVAGGGDVLVFRQVRPNKAAEKETKAAVNPIDMMGKPTALPNAAAFVSPVGFVNYEIPPVEEEVQTTPFRSNIDVRREEPVFSGPKSPTPEEERSRRKKSLGKRVLVGGAWVAGISYALGVVSEYFLTGGADGRGPTGL